MTGQVQALPSPLVHWYSHPFKWTRQKLALTVIAVLGAHVGKLIVVALYYIVFEVWHPITQGWHELGPEVLGMATHDWTYWRHLLRGVGEGVLGGTLAQLLVFNHYRKRNLKPPSAFDRFEMRLHIPNIKDSRHIGFGVLLAFPLLVLLYGVPGFAVGGIVTHYLHLGVATAASHASYLQRLEAIYTSETDKQIIGLFASLFLARRPIRAVANDTQEWFAEHRILRGKPLHWYHTPVFKARYNDLKQHPQVGAGVAHAGVQATVMSLTVFACIGLAGFGYYVLTVIAKGG